jgi:hypothetical protein
MTASCRLCRPQTATHSRQHDNFSITWPAAHVEAHNSLQLPIWGPSQKQLDPFSRFAVHYNAARWYAQSPPTPLGVTAGSQVSELRKAQFMNAEILVSHLGYSICTLQCHHSLLHCPLLHVTSRVRHPIQDRVGAVCKLSSGATCQ